MEMMASSMKMQNIETVVVRCFKSSTNAEPISENETNFILLPYKWTVIL